MISLLCTYTKQTNIAGEIISTAVAFNRVGATSCYGVFEVLFNHSACVRNLFLLCFLPWVIIEFYLYSFPVWDDGIDMRASLVRVCVRVWEANRYPNAVGAARITISREEVNELQ